MKKNVKIIIAAIVFLIIAVLVGMSFIFVSQNDKLQDSKKTLSKEVVLLNENLTRVTTELNKITDELEGIENKIKSAKSENQMAKQTIAANAWDILQIGEAATEKLSDIRIEYREAGEKFEKGQISAEGYRDILAQAIRKIDECDSLINRAATLGKKYEPYVSDSFDNNMPELPSDDLTKQMNSLEKENENLIKQIKKNESDITKYETEYNSKSLEYKPTRTKLAKEKNKIQSELKTKQSTLEDIKNKLGLFPYNLISVIRK